MELNRIASLLESEDSKDLEEARRLTREILTNITAKISALFLDRLKLMWLIASSKRNSEAILQLGREYELIKKFSELTKEQKWDYKMVEMLIWLITASWKEKQRQILSRSSVFVRENIDSSELLSNLLGYILVQSAQNLQNKKDIHNMGVALIPNPYKNALHTFYWRKYLCNRNLHKRMI